MTEVGAGGASTLPRLHACARGLASVNWLDLVVAGVVLLSGLLAFLRGFVREVLSVGAWIGAAAAAFFAYPFVVPHLAPYLEPPWVADAGAAGAVFLVALLVLSLASGWLGDLVQDSRLGAVDRSLGLLFGLARGALIVAVAFIGFRVFWGGGEAQLPPIVRDAQTRPAVQIVADWLWKQLPDSMIPARAEPARTQAPSPGLLGQARPGQAVQPEGYRPDERRALDRLIETTR